MNKHIAKNAETVTDGTAQTGRQLGDVSVHVESISDNLKLLADSTTQISDLSGQVHELTTSNSANMDNAISEMKMISDSTIKSQTTIKELEARSNEILQIVKVITNISMQTNILALNATIEAARAGVAGRGFTVVAAEIRRLAAQTQEAVDNITLILDEVVNDTNKAVSFMNENTKLVASGLELINVAEASSKRIMTAAEEMTTKIQEVDGVTQEVAESSDRIVDIVHTVKDISVKNLEDMKGVTRATASGVDEMEKLRAMVENLGVMAGELNEVVHEG